MKNKNSKHQCAKCHQNAKTETNYWEHTITYPIRDKDGQIYCWDCYKSLSYCQGCYKSVANLKLPKSGNPYYPHVSGYGKQCEEVWNEVNFICSEQCGKNLAAKRSQDFQNKLKQGWTKCKECMKFWIDWIDEYGSEEHGKWMKEEKNHYKFIKLVSPKGGELCSDHKNWEEGKEQFYQEQAEIKQQAQKYWDSLSHEERINLVKRERPWGENYQEIAARQEIDAAVLRRFSEKASHEKHGCLKDCCRERNYPNQESTENNASFSGPSTNKLSSQEQNSLVQRIQAKEAKLQQLEATNENLEERSKLAQEITSLKNQQQKQNTANNHGSSGKYWFIGLSVIALVGIGTCLLIKKNSIIKVKSKRK